MKKRIGIVTLPLHVNYGGILQAYALQEVLRRMGCEPVTFAPPYLPRSTCFKQVKYFIIKAVKRYLLFQKVDTLFPHKKELECFKNKEVFTRRFIDQYIKTLVISDFGDVKSDYQCLIIGSDQVWRPLFFGNDILSNAYLAFAKGWNVRRVAYAASFGTDEWEYTPEQTKKCGALLRTFDAVSVREDAAVSMVKEHFGVDAVHVLDPTMLLDKEDYEQLVADSDVKKSEGDLFCYILDEKEELDTFIKKIADKHHLTPFSVGIPDNRVDGFTQVQPPVEQWLRGFMDARLVITDSFHACVFSIIFHKPFLVVGNDARGNSRFESLLTMFGLQSRFVKSDETMVDALDPLPENVYEKLYTERIIAINFLNGGLLS